MIKLINREKEEEETCNKSQHWFKRYSTWDCSRKDKEGRETKWFGIICERCQVKLLTNQPMFQHLTY